MQEKIKKIATKRNSQDRWMTNRNYFSEFSQYPTNLHGQQTSYMNSEWVQQRTQGIYTVTQRSPDANEKLLKPRIGKGSPRGQTENIFKRKSGLNQSHRDKIVENLNQSHRDKIIDNLNQSTTAGRDQTSRSIINSGSLTPIKKRRSFSFANKVGMTLDATFNE